MRQSRAGGAVTVMLTMIFAIIAGMLATCLSQARQSLNRFQTECAMDMGLFSVFAEYNRELLDQYELFFMDTTYGNGQPSYHDTEGHLMDYVKYNLNTEQDLTFYGMTDLDGLEPVNVEITQLSLATDHEGAAVKREAIDYMTARYGLEILNDLQGQLQEVSDYELLSMDVEGSREETESEIEQAENDGIQVSEDEWVEVEIDNPADTVNANRTRGILNFTVSAPEELSEMAVDPASCCSGRVLSCGSGLSGLAEEEFSYIESLVFNEYCIQQMSCYTDQMETSQMKYQLEYLIAGHNSDIENLREVCNTLVWIREAANVIYLFQDPAKSAEADAFALAITSAMLAPYLQPVVKASLLFAWAYAESVYDVRSLLDGHKIPIMKTAADWHLSLTSMLDYENHLGEASENERGLDYEMYLRLLLALEDEGNVAMRAMDMIELDIRATPGNASFRMDGCIAGVTARLVVSDNTNHYYDITRTYHY